MEEKDKQLNQLNELIKTKDVELAKVHAILSAIDESTI
jgi:hypothetical protein